MEISDKIKDLLNKYKEEINNNDFIYIYNDLNNTLVSGQDIGKITEVFLSAGINPLKFLNEVPDYFLYEANIKQIQIPSNITRIGRWAFERSKLEMINISGDLYQGIDTLAFAFCGNLKTVNFNKVISIGKGAFFQCFNLENIKLPEGVKYLSGDAFYGSGLKTIYIPKSVNMFSNSSLECDNLETLYFGGNKDEWEDLIHRSDVNIGIPDKTEIIYNS